MKKIVVLFWFVGSRVIPSRNRAEEQSIDKVKVTVKVKVKILACEGHLPYSEIWQIETDRVYVLRLYIFSEG